MRRLAAALLSLAAAAQAQPLLKPCHLKGVEAQALCGQVQRPLDPAKPQGTQIAVHFAVLPALARNPRPDPVFFFAGGPGQSAMDLAGPVSRQFSRLLNRRAMVFIDQRGTGRSASLACPGEGEAARVRPLAQTVSPEQVLAELAQCRGVLQQRPHGDLRHYTTPVAMADADAVRAALGAEQVNLLGASYGTRAVLEYMRQFPARVRRAVIDGVAPPDMVLPRSFGPDNQAALEAMFAHCEASADCRTRHPNLRATWQALLAALPRTVSVAHPVTGQDETVRLDRASVLQMVRGPLYVPGLASALPPAIDAAAQGRFAALLGLATALGAGMGLSSGMHFSVVCSEDLGAPGAAAPLPAASAPDFGSTFTDLYSQACRDWPRGTLPAAFYTVPPAPAATLVLSGGADPATPPHHGERVARQLGARARHLVVPEAGHGVMGIGCMRDVVLRFVAADTEADALKEDGACARAIPRPPVAVPLAARPEAAK